LALRDHIALIGIFLVQQARELLAPVYGWFTEKGSTRSI
jgi:hypothetical protein